MLLKSDTTDVRREEIERNERLSEALADAQRANQSKTVFFSNLSHDLRTPMHAIVGYTEFARRCQDREQMSGYLEKIDSSSKYMLALINDVLEMSRIESGKMELVLEDCDIVYLVNEVYDLLHTYHFYITHSIKLHIAHTLLAPRGTKLSDIKEVYSHEQALRQCADFLNQGGYQPHLCRNTAEAAKLVAASGRTDIAALGSRDCAELYDLEILSDDVQNNQNNYTRFICISKTPEIYPGAKKTSILLTLAHKPGALYHAIARFASLGLNLTKLESRPIPGSDFEFLFYFDIEAPVDAPALRSLIARLERNGEIFTYLGTYTEE